MATSGVNVLNRTAAQIIESALRRARIIPVRQSVGTTDITTGLEALNNLIAKLRSQGWHLWKSEEYIVFLEQGKTDYNIGPSGDRATLFDGFIQDALTVATAATDTVLNISDTSRFTGSNNTLSFDPATSTADWTTNNATLIIFAPGLQISAAGVGGYAEYSNLETTNATEYFFEFNLSVAASAVVDIEVRSGLSDTVLASQTGVTAGPVVIPFTATEATTKLRIINQNGLGTINFDTITLKQTDTGEQVGFRVDDSLREWNIVTRVLSSTQLELKNPVVNIASVGQTVVAFKSLPPRPLKNRNYRSKSINFDDEIPVNTWSRAEYFKQTIKSSQGLPTQAYYQPTLTNGRLYIWQTASDVNQSMLFTGDLPIEVFEDTTNNPDFPAEWFEMLSWNLAALIAPEYGVPLSRQGFLDSRAALEMEDAMDWDEEQGSLLIGPDDNAR